MARFFTAAALCTFTAAALAWASPAHAFGEKLVPNVKIDAGFNAWFKVYTPQKEAMKNLAPWYTYFPYDPALMSPPQRAPFPTWPTQFPPAGHQGTQQNMQAAPRMGAYPPNTPVPAQPGQVAGTLQTPVVLPVGYYGTNVPTYWFGR